MRARLAALLLAVLVTAVPFEAARAQAPAASPFEEVAVAPRPRHSYTLAWTTAFVGAALVAGSFPLAREADRRYERYLTETDLAQIDARFDATTRMDRLASGALLTGEVLLATAVWLRFVRHSPPPRHLSLDLQPSRCAVSLRF